MRNRRGEIATILTIGALVIIGIATIASSLTSNIKKTTSSRASMACLDGFKTCGYGSSSDCCDPSSQKCSAGKCVALTGDVCSAGQTCGNGNTNTYYKKGSLYYSNSTCTTSVVYSTYCAAPTSTCKEMTCNTSSNKYRMKNSLYYKNTDTNCAGSTQTLTAVCPPPECAKTTCSSNPNKSYWWKSPNGYSAEGCNGTAIPNLTDYCKAITPDCTSSSNTPGANCTQTCEQKGSLRWICSGSGTTTPCNSSTYGTGCTSECKLSSTNSSVKYLCTSTPAPVDACTSGQKFVGTLGYNVETPEQICSAYNGVYVGSSQQGKVGEQRWACCSVSNSNPNAACPKPGLGYACCVVDSRCDNDTNRYRWYGCTGQVCSATIISTKGGPGHLVDCPYGVNKQNQESCESALTPPKLPSAKCTDYGSYGLLGGCREKCGAGYECKSAEGDASGERRFCCPPPPETPPTNGTTTCPSSPFPKKCKEYCTSSSVKGTGGNNLEFKSTMNVTNGVQYWTDSTCKTAFDPSAKCECGTGTGDDALLATCKPTCDQRGKDTVIVVVLGVKRCSCADKPPVVSPLPPASNLAITTCKAECGTSASTTPDTQYYKHEDDVFSKTPDGLLIGINQLKVACGCAKQGTFFTYSKCDKQYDCRDASDKNNPKCNKGWGVTDPYDDCSDTCKKDTFCYMNGWTSKPYLYCCEER